MEAMVEKYIDDIRNYAARPTLALYAASRLADACIAGRVENWRAVVDVIFELKEQGFRNEAAQDVWWKLTDYFPSALDHFRAVYLWTEGFRKMYGHALFEYRERFTVGELQPDTYWHNPDGDLSAADIEAEEKFRD